jgi:hypothetical protein
MLKDGIEPTTTSDETQGLGVLLTGGDWACALGDADVLAEVARTLFPCVAAPLQMELAEIAKLAYRDFSAASTRWVQLSGHLRAHLMLASRDFGKYQA